MKKAWIIGLHRADLLDAPNDDGHAVTVATKADLTAIPVKVLLELYNKHRAKPIKKFKDTKTAHASVWKLLTETLMDKQVGGVVKKRASGGGRKGTGIGAFCLEQLAAGKSVDDVLAAALKKFPGAKTTKGSVAWYKTKLGGTKKKK